VTETQVVGTKKRGLQKGNSVELDTHPRAPRMLGAKKKGRRKKWESITELSTNA